MPNKTEPPLVVETKTEGLLMVQSRTVQPGAFWAVQNIGGRYRCTCPAGRRGRCAHIDAAWAEHPLLTVVDDDPRWVLTDKGQSAIGCDLAPDASSDVFDTEVFYTGGAA